MATEKYLIQIKVDIQNDKQLQALTTQLQKAAKQAPVTAKAMKQATASTKRFGNVAQNVGYQVQDMAVQIQGGVDPMRAMSQQLPQMLVGFGAWGAAIGVVTALLPTLVTLLKDSNDEIKDTEEEAAKAAKKADELAKSFDAMEASIAKLDFDSVTEQFEAANTAQQALIASTLEYRRALAGLAVDTAGSALQLPIDIGFESGAAAREIYIKQLNEFAESIGLASDQMIVLESRFRAALEPETRSAENLGTLIIKLQEIFRETGSTNTALQAYIENLIKLQEAQSELSSGNDKILTDIQAQSTAIESVSTATAAQVTEVDKLIAANDYLQQQNEYLDKTWELQQKGIQETADSYSILDDATGIFLQTFDTAVNGVAQGTQSMSDAFENMTKAILLQIGKLLAIQGIGSALSGQGGFLGQVGAALLAEKGAVVSGGSHLTAYAKGGVVSGPTLFPMKNGAGLMGEAGAEAVMPLTRMRNGNLGVESSGMNVVINNNASGVEVRPRQTDQGLTIDVVMSAVSQAVRRGGNEVAESIEQSYALNRGRAVYGN
jgi:hypothetical protein